MYEKRGKCDNAARMLAFILAQDGYSSTQWNMVTDADGHSVLRVTLPDGQQIMADPYFGYVAVDGQNNLIAPDAAQERIRKGTPLDKVLVPLGDRSNPRFYRDFANAHMAAEGDDLTIEAILPALTTGAYPL